MTLACVVAVAALMDSRLWDVGAPAHAVAQKIVSDGYDSLTTAQKKRKRPPDPVFRGSVKAATLLR